MLLQTVATSSVHCFSQFYFVCLLVFIANLCGVLEVDKLIKDCLFVVEVRHPCLFIFFLLIVGEAEYVLRDGSGHYSDIYDLCHCYCTNCLRMKRNACVSLAARNPKLYHAA